jgi:hypothetical protein
MSCLVQAAPAKETRATLIMAMVGLHMIEAKIRKTQNLKERRKFIDEFNSKRRTIEKYVQILREGIRRRSKPSHNEPRRTMP